jgi:hypothetical protein
LILGEIQTWGKDEKMEGLVLIALIGGLVGLLIGQLKNQPAVGFGLGLLLGPIGWLIMAVMPNAGPRCPACKSVVNKGATRCVNCGSSIKFE